MIPTKKILVQKQQLQMPLFFNREKDDKKIAKICRQLQRTLENWEDELRFWLKEYQTLKKIANLHGLNTREKRVPFYRLRKAIELQMPKHHKALQSLHVQLRISPSNCFATVSKQADEMQELDQKFKSFRRKINQLKLDFFNELLQRTPLTIL